VDRRQSGFGRAPVPIGEKSNTDLGSFKTPTVRDVELTAPYMHDVSLTTLEEVVEHYDKGGSPNPSLDPEMKPLRPTKRESADLVAFMKALTGDHKGLDELLPRLSLGPDGDAPDPHAALTPPSKKVADNFSQPLVHLIKQASDPLNQTGSDQAIPSPEVRTWPAMSRFDRSFGDRGNS
jgi:hypothetical protein